MNVNIYLIDETIVIVAPHVEKKPVYTTNSMYENGSAEKTHMLIFYTFHISNIDFNFYFSTFIMNTLKKQWNKQ